MKKILMYTADKIYTGKRITGGIKRFKLLYEGLIKNNYIVDLYCGEKEEDLLKYNKNAKSIYKECAEKNFLFPNMNIMLKNLKLLSKLKKEKYNIVIVFDVPTAISLALMNFKHIHLFLRQDLIEYRKIVLSESKKNFLYKAIYIKFMKLCEAICCKKAEKIIIQCKFDFNNLVNRHRILKNKIIEKSYVQINNVNAPWIEKKSKQIIEMKKENEFSIGFVGDFSSLRKGHGILLPALKELIDEKYNIRAYIIGGGTEQKKYEDMYRDYERITFLGRLENPISIVKNMDLMIVPSLADSCPNTILESIYNDILVIGTDTGGIPEIMYDKNFLFEINSKSIKNKVICLIENQEFKEELLKKQMIRKQELTFNWEEKIIKILG